VLRSAWNEQVDSAKRNVWVHKDEQSDKLTVWQVHPSILQQMSFADTAKLSILLCGLEVEDLHIKGDVFEFEDSSYSA